MKITPTSYLGILVLLIAGASAVWIIYHAVYSNTLPTTINGSEAKYGPLQQSILNQQP